MAIQTKVTVSFDGTKVDMMAGIGEVTKSVPGGMAFSQDGNGEQHTGNAIPYTLSNITMRIRPSGLDSQGFNPSRHMESGQEFEVSYNEGDPLLGGTMMTLQKCLCRDVRFSWNNETGDTMVRIGTIQGTRRVPY